MSSEKLIFPIDFCHCDYLQYQPSVYGIYSFHLAYSFINHLSFVQVIESVFQQDHGQVGTLENLSKNVLAGKGQVTAMTALKELRKISNLLSEM